MPSDYAFSDKDLELFAISFKDLLKFSFKSDVSEAAENHAAQVGVVESGVAQVGVADDNTAQYGAAVDEVREVDATEE